MEPLSPIYQIIPSAFYFKFREITTQLGSPNVLNPPSSSVNPAPVQLLLKFVLHTKHKYTTYGFPVGPRNITTDSEFEETKERSVQIDMHMLRKRNDKAHEIISNMLVFFGVGKKDELDHHVRDIIKLGKRMGKKVSNKGRRVLGLCIDMERRRDGYRIVFPQNQRREISVPAETGMVPASEASILKVLKRVRGEEEEEEESCDHHRVKRRTTNVHESCCCCTICMEEFEEGSEQVVSKMPCEHVFHHECIVTWLKQSHYCPLCRFQVSTMD